MFYYYTDLWVCIDSLFQKKRTHIESNQTIIVLPIRELFYDFYHH